MNNLRFRSVAELLQEYAAEDRRCRSVNTDGHLIDSRWGGWALDPKWLVLHLIHDGDSLYEIDLERCFSSMEVLDWIFQIHGKNWKPLNMGRVVAGLVRAFEDTLHPQATLCSFGQDLRLTKAQIKERIDEVAAKWPEESW